MVRHPSNKLSIWLTTDFCAPKWGGVETHSVQLASCLIERGHKVIMITNSYRGVRTGIRVLGNGMKVYHLPLLPIVDEDVAYPCFLLFNGVFRDIFIREHVDIVHGHLTTSITAAMVLRAAELLNIRYVMSEHSNYSFNELGLLQVNKALKFYLCGVNATIAVSHASKDNFTLRAKVRPDQCYVIPNAVDTDKFTPNPSLRFPLNSINIVHISRLA